MNHVLAIPVACWLAICSNAAQADGQQLAALRQLGDLSLEQLGNIEVTSVSGRPESLQTAAASIHVITAQDIRRSAATRLPEVLRLAPNLQVAQASNTTWAISARGFNNPISNKLLVLIDGRPVYSSLFSGVFWDTTQLVLEDIERIEVISGPGGTLWGANAVNGVINVITRTADKTVGTLASARRSVAGGREVARWGTRLGEESAMRLYALADDRAATVDQAGVLRTDATKHHQAGWRADGRHRGGEWTFQGDIYAGGGSPGTRAAPEVHGGNIVARWSDRLADESPYTVQAWYDIADRDDRALLSNRAQTLGVQFTHEPRIGWGHLLWGAGHRAGRDRTDPNAVLQFVPTERRLEWTHLFAQHQALLAERWQTTVGVKLERNSYTGLEVLPSARLAFMHSPQSTSWAAVSRAVRAPSRVDRELFFFLPGNIAFIAGGPNFQSEVATVYEVGHRQQPTVDLSYSATLFRQKYSGLRAGIPGAFPTTVENQIEGTADGLEAWGQWQATRDWRLSAGYTHLRKNLRFSSGATDATSIPNLGNDPRYQVVLRSSLDLGSRSEFDVQGRRVGRLPTPAVPAYTAVDARLSVLLHPTLRLAVLGQNLFDRRHLEFLDGANGGTQLARRLFLQLTWQP